MLTFQKQGQVTKKGKLFYFTLQPLQESLGSPAPSTTRQENCVPQLVPLFSRFMIAQIKEHIPRVVVDKKKTATLYLV